MSFRQKILLLSFFLLTASCSYFFKEDQEPSTVYTFTLSEKAGVSCIQDNGRILGDYFGLERSDAALASDLNRMKACLKNAVDLFVKHTKGAEPNVYTSNEIHDFLASLFESYDFSSAFMQEVITLKHSLLGGSLDRVSKQEIRQLNAYIDFIYDSLIRLTTHRHRLFSKTQDGKMAEFEAGAQQFLQILGSVKNLPRKADGDFNYKSVIGLLEHLFDSDSDWAHWQKTFVLINSLQALLTVGQLDTMKISHFPHVAMDLGHLYLGYIQFHKYVKDEDVLKDLSGVFMFPGLITRIVKHHEVFSDEKVDALVKTQDRIATALKSAVDRAPQDKIPLFYFDILIQTLHQIGSIPESIQQDTLQEMMPELFGCWLTDNRDCRAQGQRDKQSFSAVNIETLQRFTNEWKERQLWINKNFRNLTQRVDKKTFIQGMYRSRSPRSANINNLLKIVSKVGHLHWEDYVVIGESAINYKDMVIFNQIHTLAHLFTRPFNNNATKPKLEDYFLNSADAQFFYDWLRPMALDLKMGDPRSRTSGSQALIEINLFGSNSSKTDQLDFHEAVEYFQIAISTSNRTTHIMGEELVDCRAVAAPPDVFGYERLNATCVRNALKKDTGALILSTMPKLRSYFNTNANSNFAVLLKALEQSGRQGLIADDVFETDAFRMMGSISQYAESLFLRFDRDKNDILTPEELKKGLEHIVPNMVPIVRSSLTEKELKQIERIQNFELELVTYILRHKKLPNIVSKIEGYTNTDLIQFGAWILERPGVMNRMSVTREDIFIVVSTLSAFSRLNRLKQLRLTFERHQGKFDAGITNPDDVAIREIKSYLQCSTFKDQDLQLWLLSHQDEYWKNVLTIREVRERNGVVEREDVRNQGAIARFMADDDWQNMVVKELLRLLNADPNLGPVCLLPMIEELNRIQEEQEVLILRCTPATNFGLGVSTETADRCRYDAVATPY